MDVGGESVAVLPFNGHAKYLGRKLTFNDHNKTELNNRVGAAWRKFNLLRNELTNKRYSRIHAALRYVFYVRRVVSGYRA